MNTRYKVVPIIHRQVRLRVEHGVDMTEIRVTILALMA
jgi:hypothetical protein